MQRARDAVSICNTWCVNLVSCVLCRRTCCAAAAVVVTPSVPYRAPKLDMTIASPGSLASGGQPATASPGNGPPSASPNPPPRAISASGPVKLEDATKAHFIAKAQAGPKSKRLPFRPKAIPLPVEPNMPRKPRVPVSVTRPGASSPPDGDHDAVEEGDGFELPHTPRRSPASRPQLLDGGRAVADVPPHNVAEDASKELVRPVLPRAPVVHFPERAQTPQLALSPHAPMNVVAATRAAITTTVRAAAEVSRPPDLHKIRSLDQLKFTASLPRLARTGNPSVRRF